MQTHKFLMNLGLAKRANRATFGFDEVTKQVELGNAQTVFITNDVSVNTLKRVKRMSDYYEVKIQSVDFTMYDIGNAVGRKPTAVFTTTDKGFDKLLHKSLEMNGGNA